MVNLWQPTLIFLFVVLASANEYDKCPEFEGPTVWIDDAPDCLANSSYCHHFGLEYVCTANITEEGNPCLGGAQVKCTSPPAPRLAPPLPVNTLKLITYNVWELKYLISQIGQRERTCRIPAKVLEAHPDVDVVVFQEMFMGGCIVNTNNSLTARDILGEYGFSHYTRTVGDWFALLPGGEALISATGRNSSADNGGVFIASRWPIVREEQSVFDNFDGTTADALSAKGVMYAQIRKTINGESQDFHVFGTHLQATENPESPGVRVLQAGEIFDFMKGLGIPTNEPVIYAGDLNGDLFNKEENALAIMAALNATLAPVTGPIRVTYDNQNNDNLSPSDKDGQFLDYVLISNAHEQPSKATVEVFRPRMETPVEVCRGFRLFQFFIYPHSPDCRRTKVVSDLADHYPVVGQFEYEYTTGGGKAVISTAVSISISLVTTATVHFLVLV